MKLFILDITYFPGFVQSFLVSNFFERFDAAGIRGFGGVLGWAKTRASSAFVSTIDEILVHQAKGPWAVISVWILLINCSLGGCDLTCSGGTVVMRYISI